MKVRFEMDVVPGVVIHHSLHKELELAFAVVPGMRMQPAKGWASVEVTSVTLVHGDVLVARLKRIQVDGEEEVEALREAGWRE